MQAWNSLHYLRSLRTLSTLSARTFSTTTFKLRQLAGVCALLLAGASPAQEAQELQNPPAPASQEDAPLWLAASDHELEQLRGGFSLGQGLMVSFGVSRAVYINGQLVTSTSFQVNDLTRLNPAQTALLARQIPAQAQLVQNGPGNQLAPDAVLAPFTTYIQNTLNEQTLRSQTVIQASTNGLAMVKNLNLQTTLNDALGNAIRQR
jgi:hypothetical protein